MFAALRTNRELVLSRRFAKHLTTTTELSILLHHVASPRWGHANIPMRFICPLETDLPVPLCPCPCAPVIPQHSASTWRQRDASRHVGSAQCDPPLPLLSLCRRQKLGNHRAPPVAEQERGGNSSCEKAPLYEPTLPSTTSRGAPWRISSSGLAPPRRVGAHGHAHHRPFPAAPIHTPPTLLRTPNRRAPHLPVEPVGVHAALELDGGHARAPFGARYLNAVNVHVRHSGGPAHHPRHLRRRHVLPLPPEPRRRGRERPPHRGSRVSHGHESGSRGNRHGRSRTIR